MAVEPCPPSPTPVTRGVVTFDPAVFKAAYPMFATVADAALIMNFSLSQLFLNNSCRSIVCDANTRETLLNLLVAHITALFQGVNGAAPAGIVGRVSDATEGSVSVTAAFPENPGAAWFDQTQWGAMFWAATLPWRTFRYIPPPVVCADLAGGGVFPVGPNPGGGCGC